MTNAEWIELKRATTAAMRRNVVSFVMPTCAAVIGPR
jgi:hypothetical protein